MWVHTFGRTTQQHKFILSVLTTEVQTGRCLCFPERKEKNEATFITEEKVAVLF